MSSLKTTWHHIRRSPIQSFAATFIMSISFFILSVFILTNQGLTSVLVHFESKPEITIFLKDGLDRSTVENIQKELASYPDIKEIRFISKEKALNIYKEQNKDNPLLTEMVTSSILPASFEVTATNPSALKLIADNFQGKTTVVDEIIYQKDIIDTLLNWTNIVRKSGVILVSVMGSVSFLTTFIIIGMKITNRKEEIRISRLLGASKFYVKRPFLLEGIFYGLIGSLLGSLTSITIIFYFSQQINTFFQPVIVVSKSLDLYMLLIILESLIGIFVGFFASWFGSKRYISF